PVLLQLRKFFTRLPASKLHVVRDFLLAIYEPECARLLGWHFSSLVSARLGEYPLYALWQFAQDFHDKAKLREHCRRLCVDILEQSGYINDMVVTLYQSRRHIPGFSPGFSPGLSPGLLGEGGSLLSNLPGNWPGTTELEDRKIRLSHQKLERLMVLALCRTETSYMGILFFQRAAPLPLREYALAELQGLFSRGDASATAECFYGQPRQPWKEICTRLKEKDVCRKDWQQARRFLRKHPIEDFSERTVLEQAHTSPVASPIASSKDSAKAGPSDW
ncbi:MAG: hypothetical protein AAF975_09675, partial [Spirochaetota bacterium]